MTLFFLTIAFATGIFISIQEFFGKLLFAGVFLIFLAIQTKGPKSYLDRIEEERLKKRIESTIASATSELINEKQPITINQQIYGLVLLISGLIIITLTSIFGLDGSVFLLTLFLCVRLIASELLFKHHEKEHWLQLWITIAFSIYYFIKAINFSFYEGLNRIAVQISNIAGSFVNRPLTLGVTYSGIDVIVFFLICFTVLWIMSPKKRMIDWLMITLSFCSIWFCYMILWTYFVESSIILNLNIFRLIIDTCDYRCILFSILTGVFFLCRKSLEDRTVEPVSQRSLRTWLSFFVIFSAGIVMWSVINSEPKLHSTLAQRFNLTTELSVQQVFKRQRILFFDSSLKSTDLKKEVNEEVKNEVNEEVNDEVNDELDHNTNYKKNNDETKSQEQSNVVRDLSHYLKMKGYRCEIKGEITAEDLEAVKLLVIEKGMVDIKEQTITQIYDFIAKGGSLLAIGNHTENEQNRIPFNHLLSPVAVAFEFDSTVPFQNVWADNFKLSKHYIWKGVSLNHIQLNVGASLSVRKPAKPILYGINGYSDRGDFSNAKEGFSGDMHLNRGERVGDLILGAEAFYGEGKILIFGDTTPFKHASISYNHLWIDNVFSYLTGVEQPLTMSQALAFAEFPDFY